ncbi:MAG: NAD-dependent protein deacylase [Lachnospiraceae bacterium]|nr:NAD-dependent protein deacylase [Lachnospiraceae bacterium]MBQ6197517.1 NAD-dependent protein deacylase [Lachnospiraceae bacterium]
MTPTEQLSSMLRESSRIVFFGGAGVSTASGIPDFRSASGLYNQKYKRTLSPEEMVSHSFFVRDPEDFFDFYRDKLIYPEAKPNDCHKALAALEQAGKLTAVVTQNIDGLHQMAGSKNVFELHGSVRRNYCVKCHKFFDETAVLQADGVPHCDHCGGVIKPDVVLYEEMLDEDVMDGAARAIMKADMLIIGGTSLVVYPAAGFVRYFRGRHLVLINKSVTPMDDEAELVIHEDIAAVMGEAVRALGLMN